MAKEVLLLLCIPLMLAFIGVMITAAVALYLESIRPHLVKILKEREHRKPAKITGISLSVDIEREQRGTVKDEQYRYRA